MTMRSLPGNEKTVTPDRVALGDVTINGLRTVKYHVKVCGEPLNVHILNGFLRVQERHTEFMPKGFLMKKRTGNETENKQTPKRLKNRRMLRNREKRKQRSWTNPRVLKQEKETSGKIFQGIVC